MYQTLPLLLAFALLATLDRGVQAEPPQGRNVTPHEPTASSTISGDEDVVFYPTSASYDTEHQTWSLPVHGIIYEPETDSWRRNALMGSMRRALSLKTDEPKSQFLDRRLRLFLVDNERDQEIFIRIGSQTFSAGTSEENGHFRKTIVLTDNDVHPLAKQDADGRWLPFTAVTQQSDDRQIEGRVQLIEPEGLSIISDIDDTIKHSVVTDRKKLLANTFFRKFSPVAGMPELYRKCAERGIVFHYVSGSPWQLYLPLAEFMKAEDLPIGSFHLKHFRLKDQTLFNVVQSQESHKLPAIESILTAYPQRRFILIGDSGEQDPEIYAKVARIHHKQVVAIFIRNVTEETADNPRFHAVREGLGDVRFELFDEPGSLLPIIQQF